MEKNTYFEEMASEAIAWSKARTEREKEREALKAADDWDGVKAWDKKEKTEHPYPFTEGAVRALRAYDRSLNNGADAFEIDDLPWDRDFADFVDTLRKAGITAAVVTDQSTALMDGIYALNALGCTMTGLKAVTRKNDCRFGTDKPEVKNGIEFSI